MAGKSSTEYATMTNPRRNIDDTDSYVYHLILSSYVMRKFETHCPGCAMEGECFHFFLFSIAILAVWSGSKSNGPLFLAALV